MNDIHFINNKIKNILLQTSIQDYAFNGIQVECSGEINKIGLAVDASLQTIEKAIESDCNLILVHHGMLWGRELPITGNYYKRIKLLIENNIGLIAYHLPLDGHAEIGNNTVILKMLKADSIAPFYFTKNFPIGYAGVLANGVNIDIVMSRLNMQASDIFYLNFGSSLIKNIAVVSGSGGKALDDAASIGADLLITGDRDHTIYHPAKEYRINVLFAGHYHTETFGIKALGEYISDETGIASLFIDIPTGL